MHQRTLTRLGRRFLFRKFWEEVRPPPGVWEGLASLIGTVAIYTGSTCQSVSQLFHRSRPALTPPPARSPAPPLPVGDL